MAHRAVCLMKDPALRRTLRRTLQAAGSEVLFAETVDELDALAGGTPPDLVIVDRQTRLSHDMAKIAAVLGADTKIVALGESLETDEILALLRGSAFDHVIAEST